MKQHFLGLIFGVIGFCLGFAAFNINSNTVSATRDPAALNGKVFQISTLSSDEMKSYIQKKLSITATQNGLKQIAFTGFSSGICKTYTSIELELVAEGVSVAGEPPVLKITNPCEAGNNEGADIAAVTLPIDLLLKEKPRNTDYSFVGYKSVMTLQNSADEWPHTWVVRKIEFKNISGTDSKQAHFGRAPASAEAPRPIVLEF